MSRILVIVPVPLGPEGVARRQAQAAGLANSEHLEFEFRPVKVGGGMFDNHFDRLFADVGVVAAGADAEAEGFGGVTVDSVSDSGMEALRAILDIPVIGPGRASYLSALHVGERIGVVSLWDGWLPVLRQRARDLGILDKLVSVQAAPSQPDLDKLLEGKEETVLPLLREAGRRCQTDGADVLCLASTTMHAAVGYLQDELGIPVIDPGPASYKALDSMISLGTTQSRSAARRSDRSRVQLLQGMIGGLPLQAS